MKRITVGYLYEKPQTDSTFENVTNVWEPNRDDPWLKMQFEDGSTLKIKEEVIESIRIEV
jgi:hypothetical protein